MKTRKWTRPLQLLAGLLGLHAAWMLGSAVLGYANPAQARLTEQIFLLMVAVGVLCAIAMAGVALAEGIRWFRKRRRIE